MPVDVGDVFSVRMDEEHGEDGEHEAYHQDGFSFYICKYFLHNVSRFCKIFSIISHVTTRKRDDMCTHQRATLYHVVVKIKEKVERKSTLMNIKSI